MKIIRLKEVTEITGLSRTTIWRLGKRGAFPRKRSLSPRVKGWLEKDIQKWMDTRKEA